MATNKLRSSRIRPDHPALPPLPPTRLPPHRTALPPARPRRINNAGSNAYSYDHLFDQSPEDVATIVSTNVLGLLLANRQAVRTIRDQARPGHIFNMDGAGADGRPTPRFAAYGASKAALVSLNQSLAAELVAAGLEDKVRPSSFLWYF